MHRRYLFVFLVIVLISLGSSWGQSNSTSINYDLTKRPALDQELNIAFSNQGITSFKNEEDALFFSIPLNINLTNPQPFLACDFKGNFFNYDTGKVSIFIRFAPSVDQLSDFEEVKSFHHFEINDSIFQSELMYVDPENLVFQFLIVIHPTPPGQPKPIVSRLSFNLFAPGQMEPVNTPDNPLKTQLLGANPSCGCGVPAHVSRTGWGAPPGQDYNSDPNVNPSYSTVSHLIVHHSTGSNNSNNWPARVLAIWNFHVNSNGWDDIGYNWLIDPTGMIYEGRGGGNNVVGAHFCGKNTGTMGICMIGSYENSPPTQAALNSLHRLLGWKMCDANLDGLDTTFLGTTGLNLPVISGHKDGCPTLCPGAMLFQEIPNIRQDAVVAQTSCVTSVVYEEEKERIILYPNPSHGRLNFKNWKRIPALTTVKVLDSQGRELISKELSLHSGQQTSSLDIAHLPNGMYWVELTSDKGVQLEKLMLMK